MLLRPGCSRRALVSVIVAASLSVGPAAVAHAQEPESAALGPEAESDAQVESRVAFEKGETAYRLGRFDEAAREFERAFELLGLPAFLYNIGLAYLRWYDIDPDIAHLRRAKVVFENYQIELQKDPELGDPEEAKVLLAEIDQKIAAHGASTEPPPEPGPALPDHDPGKRLRLAGAVTMGVGGALVLGGVVSGVVLALRSKEFREELYKTYAVQAETDCSDPALADFCQELDDRIDKARRNGRDANVLAGGLGLGLAGAGVIALIVGAVVFVRGNKQTREWERRRLGLAPGWLPGGGSLTLHGHF
jgi:tetratricopeptide (TPR) repeat protein